jgi:hypothetical protein
MRLDEATPGEWVCVRHEIDCGHEHKAAAEKACEAFLFSYLGERFSLMSKKIDPVVVKDDKGNRLSEKWIANIALLAHEPVLKWHAEVLSKELRRKVYPKRFSRDEWFALNSEQRKEKLSEFVKSPSIVKCFPYCYQYINKMAVFFFDESVPCQEKETTVASPK